MAPHITTTQSEDLQNDGHFSEEEFRRFERYISFEDGEPYLWIFGYGSLIWLPKVEFAKAEIGFVEGYAVRFWQGNTTHRGTPDSPGRVATLIANENSRAWGKAFKLQGIQQIYQGLENLCGREMKLGGYEFASLEFSTLLSGAEVEKLRAITFIATPESKHYLGPAPVEEIASTIVNSRGKSGHNLEYLFRLTDSLRSIAPKMEDEHLELLEHTCHILLAGRSAVDDEYVAKCLTARHDFIKTSMRYHFEAGLFSKNAFYNVKRE